MSTVKTKTTTPIAERKALALRLLAEQVKELGWRYGLYAAGAIAFSLLTLLPAQYFHYFAGGAQALSQTDGGSFLRTLLSFGTLVAVALFLSTLGNTLAHEWLRLRVETSLRRRVLRQLHAMPMEALDGTQRGDWFTRMTGDLTNVEAFLTESIPAQLRHFTILLGIGLLFGLHGGALAFIPLLGAVVLALAQAWVQKRLAPTLGELRDLHGGIFQLLIESLEGLRTIRSHSGEPFIERRFEGKLMEISAKSFRVVRWLGVMLGSTEAIGQFLIALCLIAVARSLSRGTITVEETLLYPFFIGLFYGSAQSLASGAYEWNRFFIEGGRLGEILSLGDRPRTSRFIERTPPCKVRASAIDDLTTVGSLGVRGARLKQGDKVIVDRLSFSVSVGDLCAVVGASGCGKSTFLEVLAGLRQVDAGSADFTSLGGELLWESLGEVGFRFPIGPCAFVEQHPYLFEGTLRDNLTFGNPNRLSDAVLWDGLERAGLFSFARRIGGLEYLLQDAGRNVSQGERYRIALCRALLLRRPFLLLDEPFAALDGVSVGHVVAALHRERTRCGIVVVTHVLPAALQTSRTLDFDALPTDAVTTVPVVNRIAMGAVLPTT